MIPLALLVCGMAEPAAVGFSVPAPNGPAYLGVVASDGRTPEAAWASFLDSLFDHFDRDGDGKLSAAEAERVFPLPLPDGRAVAMNFQQLDANRDSHGSRSEFRAFYRQAGFAPVVAVVHPPNAESVRLSNALFDHLDRDRDGTISITEWAFAPGLLRRFDENEDEILDPAEVLAGRPMPAPAPPSASRVTVAKLPERSVARLDVVLGQKPGYQLVSDAGGFRVGPLTNVIDVPGGRARIAISTATPGLSSARDFYLAQFTEAAGPKPSLNAAALDADPGLSAIAAMFPAADRDGDGQLTTEELRKFLDLIYLGLACQFVVRLEDRGTNLFDLLDTNADGRLDLSELRAATRLPAVERATVPVEYRLSIDHGPVGKTFGPVRVPAAQPPRPRPAVPPTTGPAWFRAMDHNADGYLSAAEFRGPPELFAKWDTDGDGRISMKEAEASEK